MGWERADIIPVICLRFNFTFVGGISGNIRTYEMSGIEYSLEEN